MKIKRFYMLGLAALLAAGVPAGVAGVQRAAAAASAPGAGSDTAAATTASAQPAAIQAAAVQRVQMQQADMAYVPLFGSREADKADIAKAAAIVNRLLGKAKPSTEQLIGEDSFFATSFDVLLSDGSTVLLQFKDGQHALISVGGDGYIAQDATAISELGALLAMSPQSDISTRKPAIGQTIRITGSDASSQQGMIRVFVETPGSSGGYRTTKGVDYPSKRALLVYAAPYSEARYDFQFTMPAYGEVIDGTFKPITPGAYEFDVSTGGSTTMRSVTIAPPAAAQLSINGVTVSDPALAPIVSNGAMLLPMRALAEAFGWNVRWDAAHKAAIVSTLPEKLSVGSASGAAPSLWVNGKQLTGANAKPVIANGHTYLPLRATGEAFGFQVTWTQSVRGALLVFKPQLLDERPYAGDVKKLAAVKLLNGYVNALNGRDAKALGGMFAKNGTPAPSFAAIGQRLITGIRSVTFEDRPGGALLAYVNVNYLFDPNGSKTGTPGITFAQEDGVWKIADVD